MTHIPPSLKLRIYLVAAGAWVAAGVWLICCVIVEAPLRMSLGALLAVALLAVVVKSIKQDMDMDLVRARENRPGGEAAMDGNGWD